MQKLRKLVALGILAISTVFLPVMTSASSMESQVGITFTSSGLLADTGSSSSSGGKLPQTGEIAFNILFFIGIILIAFAIFYWWKRRREAV